MNTCIAKYSLLRDTGSYISIGGAIEFSRPQRTATKFSDLSFMAKALTVIGFVCATLVLFFLVSALAFYHLMRTGEFRRFLIGEIERQTDLKVELGEADLEIGWITGVAFSQLGISEPDATKP